MCARSAARRLRPVRRVARINRITVASIFLSPQTVDSGACCTLVVRKLPGITDVESGSYQVLRQMLSARAFPSGLWFRGLPYQSRKHVFSDASDARFLVTLARVLRAGN